MFTGEWFNSETLAGEDVQKETKGFLFQKGKKGFVFQKGKMVSLSEGK